MANATLRSFPMAVAWSEVCGRPWAAHSGAYSVHSSQSPIPSLFAFPPRLCTIRLPSIFRSHKAKKCLGGRGSLERQVETRLEASYAACSIVLLVHRTEPDIIHWCPVVWAGSKLTYEPKTSSTPKRLGCIVIMVCRSHIASFDKKFIQGVVTQ